MGNGGIPVNATVQVGKFHPFIRWVQQGKGILDFARQVIRPDFLSGLSTIIPVV
jgi:hypothetical protein